MVKSHLRKYILSLRGLQKRTIGSNNVERRVYRKQALIKKIEKN